MDVDKRALGWFPRLCLYLCPPLVDLVAGSSYFVNPIRAALMGASNAIAGTLLLSQAISYMAGNLVMARIASASNAGWIMTAGGFGVGIAALAGLLFDGMGAIYAATVLLGLSSAAVFTPFQVFIKAVDAGRKRPLERVSGLFVFSWSLGIGFGPLFSVFLLGGGIASGDTPWKRIYFLWLALSAALVAIMTYLRIRTRRATERHSAKESIALKRAAAGERSPDYAWLGWLMVGVGSMSLGVVRGVFVSEAAREGLPENLPGDATFLLSLIQAVSCLGLSYLSGWLYRGKSLAALALFGVAGLLLFSIPLRPFDGMASFSPYYLGAILYGMYGGAFYLYSSYHCLVHPYHAARKVGINESCIGAGNALGPFLGGLLADAFGYSSPFRIMTMAIIAVAAAQLLFHHSGASPPGRLFRRKSVFP